VYAHAYAFAVGVYDRRGIEGARVEFDVVPNPRHEGKFKAVNARFIELNDNAIARDWSDINV